MQTFAALRGRIKVGRRQIKPNGFRKDVAMYMRVTQGRIRNGAWKEFEAAYKRVTIPHVAGLAGRFLLADIDKEDSGHAMSLWDSLESLRAYEASDLLNKVIEPALRPYYTDEYQSYVSEIVVQK